MKKEPAVNKTTLPNGVKIISRAMPYVHSVSMGVWVNAGARDEAAAESGLSHFIEHMIFKGTIKRTAFQIAKEFDAIGGQSNAFTSMEHTCYHAKVMDAQLSTMVDILSDIFLNSVFDANEIEKERPIIFQEIGMVEDTPEEFIHLLAGQNFWGDHPLGRSILGTRENLLGFNAASIRSFFQHFYQPERIVISVAGNIVHGQIVDLVAPSFERIAAGSGFPSRCKPSARSAVAAQHKALEQVHLILGTEGLSTTDPRRFALALLNTILGGNMSSHLFQKIREKSGLAYSVYSFISSQEDSGMFGVYTGVAPHQAGLATRMIKDEMQAMRKTPVSAAELTDAKQYSQGNLYLASESPDNQMVRLAQNEFYFGRDVSLEEVMDKIEAVTAAGIHELAETLFKPDRLSLTLLGPVPDPAGFESLLRSSAPNRQHHP